MNKTQLLEIARLGIRYKLLDIERTLAAMFRDFPEEFAAKTPPVFVRPVEKAGGNSWAQATVTASTRKPMTAATKQKLARTMKRRHASGEIARAKAKKAKA